MLTETDRRALWGDLFEVAVKRGCLALLQERGLLRSQQEHLRDWRTMRVHALHRHLVEQTGAIDPGERSVLASSLDHLLIVGWGLGWTIMREYLRRSTEGIEVLALWCPLSLPDRCRSSDSDPPPRTRQVEAFWRALGLSSLGLSGQSHLAWANRGEPANADLLFLFRAGGRCHVLCLEFSLHAPPEAEDFSGESAHLGEVERFIQRLESRGVFTRIAAEITGERFIFNDALVSHLSALTTHDKPLYKLAQGSSYATRLLHWLEQHGKPLVPATAQVIAVTSAGIEALCATFGTGTDPRAGLMTALGDAYRKLDGVPANDAVLTREIQAVRHQIARSLPATLREPFVEAFASPPASREIDVRLHEGLTGYVNPARKMPVHQALSWVADAPEAVASQLGGPPVERIAAALGSQPDGGQDVSLRDLHAAALHTGLSAARPGQITVIAAEGHPGIGKTTAVLDHLRRMPPDEGYLFLYVSPRIVINTDVTQKVARDADGTHAGVLTLTTNARLIRGARRWHESQGTTGEQTKRRFVDAAVVVDGVAELKHPPGSTLFLTPDEAQQMDEEFASSELKKQTWNERVDDVRARPAPGVLATLARATRGCLEANPSLNRAVLTAAIQGYRTRDGGTSTVDRLSDLFRYVPETPHGVQERMAFARRIPTIIAMVDEIAGDGAGAPFVHALAAWLHRQFVAPFASGGSPFRVVLVLADASLANEAVLAGYLQHGSGAPEKVLVSESLGPRPLRLAGGTLQLGGRRLPVLHVMADGFPAGTLGIDYHVRLTPVYLPPKGDGASKNPRAAIQEQHGKARVRVAVQEVFAALSGIPSDQQVILFAQDKLFLRDVQKALIKPALLEDDGEYVETHGQRLRVEEIGLLDSSVPERERRHLIQEAVRDSKRVFLMTSSGARGVSFPLATVMIAFVPTFAVESGFMEIAQLIYRGRGNTRHPNTGDPVSGDTLNRRLVLLLQDFVLADEPIDSRQWLRRTIDLISALVLLRATLLTRITGDAGIPGQRAAVVPVGRIGAEDVETSLTRSVAAFLHEGTVNVRGGAIPEPLRPQVVGAIKDVQATFRNLRWTGALSDPSRRSIADEAFLREIKAVACGGLLPLLPGGRDGALPDSLYGLGPIWLERWHDVPAEEAFGFDGAFGADRQRMRRLLAGCRTIANTRELPGALRRAARDLIAILHRPDEMLEISYVARKAVESERVWICLPVDYDRFCTLPPGEENAGKRFRSEEPEHWLDSLLRASSTNTMLSAYHPVLPDYSGRPFLAMIAPGDPTGLERTFDDRYFMASSELNLLNTLLFVDKSMPEAPGEHAAGCST